MEGVDVSCGALEVELMSASSGRLLVMLVLVEGCCGAFEGELMSASSCRLLDGLNKQIAQASLNVVHFLQ